MVVIQRCAAELHLFLPSSPLVGYHNGAFVQGLCFAWALAIARTLPCTIGCRPAARRCASPFEEGTPRASTRGPSRAFFR
jgi:hypothetical protein